MLLSQYPVWNLPVPHLEVGTWCHSPHRDTVWIRMNKPTKFFENVLPARSTHAMSVTTWLLLSPSVLSSYSGPAGYPITTMLFKNWGSIWDVRKIWAGPLIIGPLWLPMISSTSWPFWWLKNYLLSYWQLLADGERRVHFLQGYGLW